MRLRKKNVSRVAAVAVAAVMAVSAAAPAAFAAAPAANGGTAVVQEASKRGICINYYNEDTGKFIQTGYVEVEDDDVYLSTSLLTDVPNGFTVAPSCPTIAVGRDVTSTDVYCVPAVTEHVIDISYKNSETGEFIHTGSVKVSADATQITADMLTDVPANWVVDPVFVPLNIDSDTKFVDIYCKPAVTEHEIVVTYRDNDTNAELGHETVKVSNSAEQLTAEMLQAVPANWKVYSASLPQNITSDTTSVDVYCVPATHKVTVEYHDAANWNTVVSTEDIEVADNADYVGIDVLKKVPAGWNVTADTTQIAVGGKTTSVAVTKATHKVTVKYHDADNWENVVGSEVIEVADNADYVGIDVLKKIPAGWAVTADTTQIAVGNKMATTTVAVTKAARKVTVEYRDADNWNTVVGTEEIEVAGDADYVGTDVLTKVPAGWTVTADTTQVAVGVDTTSVAVTKAARKVTVEYRDADNWNTVVGTEVIEVAGNADYVGTDVLTKVPAGWTVTADTTQIAVGVETTTVAVTKVTTPDPVDPTPTPAPTVNPVTTALGVGTWLLILGGLVLGFLGL